MSFSSSRFIAFADELETVLTSSLRKHASMATPLVTGAAGAIGGGLLGYYGGDQEVGDAAAGALIGGGAGAGLGVLAHGINSASAHGASAALPVKASPEEVRKAKDALARAHLESEELATVIKKERIAVTERKAAERMKEQEKLMGSQTQMSQGGQRMAQPASQPAQAQALPQGPVDGTPLPKPGMNKDQASAIKSALGGSGWLGNKV